MLWLSCGIFGQARQCRHSLGMRVTLMQCNFFPTETPLLLGQTMPLAGFSTCELTESSISIPTTTFSAASHQSASVHPGDCCLQDTTTTMQTYGTPSKESEWVYWQHTRIESVAWESAPTEWHSVPVVGTVDCLSGLDSLSLSFSCKSWSQDIPICQVKRSPPRPRSETHTSKRNLPPFIPSSTCKHFHLAAYALSRHRHTICAHCVFFLYFSSFWVLSHCLFSGLSHAIPASSPPSFTFPLPLHPVFLVAREFVFLFLRLSLSLSKLSVLSRKTVSEALNEFFHHA